MSKQLSPVTLLIATRNAHKVGEIRAILGEEFCYLTLNDFPNAPKVVEDADTFAGNATKKSVELAKWLSTLSSVARHPSPGYVLADDSGLEVDALDGAPGVHSARFAALEIGQAGNSADADNNARLLHLLKSVPLEQRTARFHCVLALTPVIQGKVESASPVCYGTNLKCRLGCLMEHAKDELFLNPVDKAALAMIPCFCPKALIRRSRSWARQQKIS